MSASTCAFCLHENPAGAKYCNDCASPLTLKPCRACDAVNERTAAACHRCHTPFAVEAPQADVSTETLVAQADETLEELRRELAQASSRASSVVGAVREPIVSAPSFLPVDTGLSQAPAPPAETIAGHEDEAPLPRGDHFISLDDASQTPPADGVPQPLRGETADAVVLRARRGSPALAVAAIILLLALPLGLYAWRNPEQVQSWIERIAAMMPNAPDQASATEPPASETPPVATPAIPAAPVEPTATTSVPPEAAAPLPTGEARTVEPATLAPPVATPDTAAPAGQVSPDPAAAAAAGAATAAAAAAAAPTAKSKAPTRPRATSSKSRSRDRAQRQRSSSTSAASKRSAPQLDPAPESVE